MKRAARSIVCDPTPMMMMSGVCQCLVSGAELWSQVCWGWRMQINTHHHLLCGQWREVQKYFTIQYVFCGLSEH